MMIAKFRSRKIKIEIISTKIRNIDIYVRNKRWLLYYSNNNTSDELWESYEDVLKILMKKKYKSAKNWWKKQFTNYYK